MARAKKTPVITMDEPTFPVASGKIQASVAVRYAPDVETRASEILEATQRQLEQSGYEVSIKYANTDGYAKATVTISRDYDDDEKELMRLCDENRQFSGERFPVPEYFDYSDELQKEIGHGKIELVNALTKVLAPLNALNRVGKRTDRTRE